MFVQESAVTGKPKLLLTAATAPDGRMSSLDIPALNRFSKFLCLNHFNQDYLLIDFLISSCP